MSSYFLAETKFTPRGKMEFAVSRCRLKISPLTDSSADDCVARPSSATVKPTCTPSRWYIACLTGICYSNPQTRFGCYRQNVKDRKHFAGTASSWKLWLISGELAREISIARRNRDRRYATVAEIALVSQESSYPSDNKNRNSEVSNYKSLTLFRKNFQISLARSDLD